MPHFRRAALGLALALGATLVANAAVDEAADALNPAAFFPSGMLGVQIGNPWSSLKQSATFDHMSCQRRRGALELFDEVCFFKTADRLAGVAIHDGFVVRKGDRVILIGMSILIKDPDDPLAETVMRDLQARVHGTLQQKGSEVLFTNLPQKRFSEAELQGISKNAPALLVELEPAGNQLDVFYGYLEPVNRFAD